MRVFMACASFHPRYGGPAASVAGLARVLRSRGLDVVMWAPDGSAAMAGDADPKLQPQRHPGGGERLPKADLASFDIIHDNGLWLPHNHRLAAIARRARIPRIVSTRGMLEPWALAHKGWKKRIALALYQRRDLASAAGLHATSQQEAANLSGLGLQVKVTTIPNGAELPLLTGSAAGSGIRGGIRRALFVGRLYPVKGLPMLIEAWARVRPTGWLLEIAGPDEAGHRQLLERAIASHGLEHQIELTGAVAGEAKELAFRRAELFVLPSYSESFGMAVAEALGYGLPVLTTTAVPWPQLEANGSGWRVAADPDALAEGLRRAMSIDRDGLVAMGRRGRDLVERELDWNRLSDAYLAMYRSACSANPRAGAAA